MEYIKYMESPVGLLRLVSNGKGITEINFFDGEMESERSDIHIEQAVKELKEYFEGKRKSFDLKIIIDGTEFRKRVWEELKNIPYGETVSYKYIAGRIGCKCARAIGGANNKNKIVIVIPCHRVIGADGSLVGYGGGLWRKEILLELEKRNKVD